MTPRIKKIAKAIIAVLVIAGLIWATLKGVQQWNAQRDAVLAEVAELDQQIESLPEGPQRERLMIERARTRQRVPELSQLDLSQLLFAAGLYALGLIPGGMVLRESTRVLGYRVPVSVAVSSQTIGHLGKYVPGKAMVVVIRAGRLNGWGVPAVAASVAVFLETILMMAVGAALAGGLIFLLPVPRWIAWTALLGGLAAALPTVPPLLRRIVSRVGAKPMAIDGPERRVNDPDDGAAGSESPKSGAEFGHDWRFFLCGWGWQLCAWVLIGAAFACVTASVPGEWEGASKLPTGVFLAASIASMALAMVVGFASLLPGGAGVRELTLALLLGPVVGPSQALLAAILARGVFIVVEVLAAALATWWARPIPSG